MSFPSARRPPHDALQKNPLDAAVIRLCDILSHPVFSEHMSGDLDDDIVGLHAGIVTVARQALQAGRAGREDLDRLFVTLIADSRDRLLHLLLLAEAHLR